MKVNGLSCRWTVNNALFCVGEANYKLVFNRQVMFSNVIDFVCINIYLSIYHIIHFIHSFISSNFYSLPNLDSEGDERYFMLLPLIYINIFMN